MRDERHRGSLHRAILWCVHACVVERHGTERAGIRTERRARAWARAGGRRWRSVPKHPRVYGKECFAAGCSNWFGRALSRPVLVGCTLLTYKQGPKCPSVHASPSVAGGSQATERAHAYFLPWVPWVPWVPRA